MNQRLEALLDMLNQHTRELAQSNARYEATNDRFAAYLMSTGLTLSEAEHTRAIRRRRMAVKS